MDAEKYLQHMAWANREIFRKLAELPDAALESFAVNPQFDVREIARHICASATWYGFRLMDKSGFSEEEKEIWKLKLEALEIPPASSQDIHTIINRLAEADARLLEESKRPEGVITRQDLGTRSEWPRSTVIFQAIHHATEHRAQMFAALELGGYTTINLDDFDMWSFTGKNS